MEKGKYYCVKCGFMHEYGTRKVFRSCVICDQSITCEIELKVCKKCGSELSGHGLIDEELLIFRDEYRRINGLLTSAEIIAIRQSLGLSNAEFASRIGMSAVDELRMETGIVQSREIDGKIRMLQ